MPQYLVQFHHFRANDEIEAENDNVAGSKPSPSCLHFCKISGGLFCFLEHVPDFTGLRQFFRIFR